MEPNIIDHTFIVANTQAKTSIRKLESELEVENRHVASSILTSE